MSVLVPIREAAREFHLDRTTLHRHIKAGRLRGYRRPLDRRTYVDRDELGRLLTFKPIRTIEPTPDSHYHHALLAALDGIARFHAELDAAGYVPVDALRLAREARRELERRTTRQWSS